MRFSDVNGIRLGAKSCHGLLLAFLTFVSVPTDSAEPKRHPAAHVIRITAGLTFDGKPVEIDDLIDCQADYTGTPTSTPHMVFKPNRNRITHKVPGGGMITFRASRELCYANGADWGARSSNYTVPDEWTPVIQWYDHRDPRKAENGIIYLSEEALTADNGRLKIVRPFRVVVPEHPASEALIADAAAQAADRDFWLGRDNDPQESMRFRRGVLPWMVRISKSEWLNPEGARIASEHWTRRRDPKPDFGALARYLRKIGGDRPVALGYLGKLDGDVKRVAALTFSGFKPGLSNIMDIGIPKTNASRSGLVISEDTFTHQKNLDPFYPYRFDDFVPFRCNGSGGMEPDSRHPGLRYWVKLQKCAFPKFNNEPTFFERKVVGEIKPRNGWLIFDPSNGDLWRISSVY